MKLNFVEVYSEYSDQLLCYVKNRMSDPAEAEDVCAEVWVSLYRSYSRMHSPERAIWQMARRKICDSARRNRSVPTELPDAQDPNSVSQDKAVGWYETAKICNTRPPDVPEHYWEVYVRFTHEGESLRQIGKSIKRSTGTVGSWVHITRKKIRTFLKEHDIDRLL